MDLHRGISNLSLSLCCDNALMHLEPPRLPAERRGRASPDTLEKSIPSCKDFTVQPQRSLQMLEAVSARAAKAPLGRAAGLAGHVPAAQEEPGGSWDHDTSHVCSST